MSAPDGGFALSGLRKVPFVGPVSASATGHYAGWRLRLIRPTGSAVCRPGKRQRHRALRRMAASPYPAYGKCHL
ncbi:hypothetical protein DNK65_19745 [Citrobacter koseri]|nr:hypothetical protein DNK65_19745 [Citrobacter koseri]